MKVECSCKLGVDCGDEEGGGKDVGWYCGLNRPTEGVVCLS